VRGDGGERTLSVPLVNHRTTTGVRIIGITDEEKVEEMMKHMVDYFTL
jgi:hypothetical protein